MGQQGLPGSFLHLLIWLWVTTTEIADVWPTITTAGMFLFSVTGVIRFALGFRFDTLYPRNPSRWATSYYAMVLMQSATQGGLCTFLLWHYHLDWPATMMCFATAGTTAGGVVALSTHPTLQRGYILAALFPSAITAWFSGDPNLVTLGALIAVYTLFPLSIGKKLQHSYWASMRNTRLLKRRATELQTARGKAESADRAKSQFVAKVSHELRTPLNGLISTISMLGQTNAPEKRRKYLEIMSKSADLLLQRINEVLDFSKLQAGKFELEPLATDPAVPL